MERYLYKRLFGDELKYWWTRSRYQMVFDWLEWFGHVSGDRKLLDVGCGAGGFLIKAKEKGFRVAGVDFSKDAIELSDKRGLKDIRLGNVISLPYQKESFDIVTALDVIEHIKEEDKAIKEIRRVLIPSGLIYLAVPALKSIWSERDKRLQHQRRYHKKELIKLVEGNGFKVLKVSFANLFFLPALFWVAKTKKAKGALSVEVDIAKTNRVFNSLFYGLLRLESSLTRYFSLPLGTSLVVLGKKVKR